jgi:NDP-sugar pyrophosphorylase family protein
MEAAAVSSVVCAVNREEGERIEGVVRGYPWKIPLSFCHETTKNSLETFLLLLQALGKGPALFSTVDAIFPPGMLQTFLQEAQRGEQRDGMLAVTDFIDDEKPLYVLLDEHKRIVRIGEAAVHSPYVAAGIYYFSEQIFTELPRMKSRGFSSLRYFLCYLVEQGYQLSGFVAPTMIDVDRPEDIVTAERYLHHA